MSKPKIDKVMVRRAQAVAKLYFQATNDPNGAVSVGYKYLQDVWVRRNGEGCAV